jgi:hypothetical protein
METPKLAQRIYDLLKGIRKPEYPLDFHEAYGLVDITMDQLERKLQDDVAKDLLDPIVADRAWSKFHSIIQFFRKAREFDFLKFRSEMYSVLRQLVLQGE